MAKAEGEKPKPTGKKRAAEGDKKPQAERFKETARLLNADETGESFERAFMDMVYIRPRFPQS